METTILTCTLIICLTAIIITTIILRRISKINLEIWEHIAESVKQIIDGFEYSEYLKKSENEKDGDLSEQSGS